MPANGSGTLTYRVGRAEQEILDLAREKASKEEVKALTKSFDQLAEKVEGMTKALYLFSLTVAASAVGLAFAVLQGGN
jgi:hypothetical protein